MVSSSLPGAFPRVGVVCLAHTRTLVDLARSDELVDERRVQHLVSIVVRTVRPVRIVSYERGVQHLVRIVSRVGIVVRIVVRIVVSRGSGVSRVSSVSVAPLLTLLTLSTYYSRVLTRLTRWMRKAHLLYSFY